MQSSSAKGDWMASALVSSLCGSADSCMYTVLPWQMASSCMLFGSGVQASTLGLL